MEYTPALLCLVIIRLVPWLHPGRAVFFAANANVRALHGVPSVSVWRATFVGQVRGRGARVAAQSEVSVRQACESQGVILGQRGGNGLRRPERLGKLSSGPAVTVNWEVQLVSAMASAANASW
jgi:hypothetical protein